VTSVFFFLYFWPIHLFSFDIHVKIVIIKQVQRQTDNLICRLAEVSGPYSLKRCNSVLYPLSPDKQDSSNPLVGFSDQKYNLLNQWLTTGPFPRQAQGASLSRGAVLTVWLATSMCGYLALKLLLVWVETGCILKTVWKKDTKYLIYIFCITYMLTWKRKMSARHGGSPLILTIQEAEIRSFTTQGQLRQKISKIPSQSVSWAWYCIPMISSISLGGWLPGQKCKTLYEK
jgi:hypothetical protein